MKTRKDYLFVGIQMLLFIAYVLPLGWVFFALPASIRQLALCISMLGFGTVILAILQLNTNLTPFPSPKTNSTLIKTGLYKYVRHPIYTGIVFFTGGLGVYFENLWKTIIAVALLLLFYFKSVYEENLLLNKFAEYEQYKKHTGRFLPFL